MQDDKEGTFVIRSLDGVCLVNLDYITPEGIDDLRRCKPGAVVRVLDVEKAVRFIDYPSALKKEGG